MYYVIYDPKFKRLANKTLMSKQRAEKLLERYKNSKVIKGYVTQATVDKNKRLIIRPVTLNWLSL